MALNKSSLNINFSKGLDLKSDPLQVAPGNFLELENSIFTKAGLLQKRNGYGAITALPSGTDASFLTTFNGNLTAIGTTLQAFSEGSGQWLNKGTIEPLDLSVQTLIRNNLNQSYADAAISTNGLICTVYAEQNAGSTTYKYVIADTTTGQNVVAPAAITGTGTVGYPPRVFFLGVHFIIVFNDNIAAVNHLKYRAISMVTPGILGSDIDISAQVNPNSTGFFDGVVTDGNLYIAWNASSTTIKMAYLTSTLVPSITISFASEQCTTISLCADNTASPTSTIYLNWIKPSTGQIKTAAVDTLLGSILAPTQIVATSAGVNIASTAIDNLCTILYESTNAYSYDAAIPTNYTSVASITEGGVVTAPTTLVRSVGLASKAFLYNDNYYFLGLYVSPYQPTYFLFNHLGKVISKLGYQNAPNSYYVNGLPAVTVTDNLIQFPYLFKDLIQAVNKDTNVAAGNQTAGIYSQTGINLCNIEFGTEALTSAEIGNNLNISGGFLTMYDGYLPVENNFFLYPDSVEVTTATGSGGLIAQKYFYQVTYEWTDNQGNAFRSAPSIPVTITTTTGSSTNTIKVPTLRLTYKTDNPVKIVIYRWSQAQQVYYQVTSITSPVLNSTTTDSISYADTASDASILGNNIIYTNGGVIENIAPPASSIMTLFGSRLFLVDSEDRNLLWYSKQIIEAVPVEMSDLFTIFIAPTTAAQGSTGPITALSALDDKLIIFKQDAIYYINGIGPDNTGANSQFSEPIFITSTVGCINPKSIVFMPNGLMFQSDKGIWLLGRDISTTYIGAPVEEFNNQTVQSAVNVPGTNQVRFTMSGGMTLMYDYYFGQWGSFSGVPAVSSCLYQSLHTYINSSGAAYQETIGAYLDGSRPVLMNFTTGWMNLAGLQGFERAYSFYLIGKYKSPHRLQIQVAYDYADSPSQTTVITPDNYSASWGADPLWGSTPTWGGQGTLEQWQVFFNQQKVQAFQISLQEVFDPTFETPAGEGLTISGLNLVVGLKKGYTTIRASRSVG